MVHEKEIKERIESDLKSIDMLGVITHDEYTNINEKNDK